MPTEKRIDWPAIRAEYLAGGISQRKLAAKHGLSYNSLRRRAESENWVTGREEQERRTAARAAQKTADAVANNAVKLERARGLAIDRLIKALEEMPIKGGTHTRKYVQEGQKRMTVDYDLLDIVNALDKLRGSDTASSTGNQLLQSLYELEAKHHAD